jgi:hypothetical protein
MRVALAPGGAHLRLSDVHEVELGAGYRVVPLTAPSGSTLEAVAVSRQPTNPLPGPGLRVRFGSGGTLAVRIVPSG